MTREEIDVVLDHPYVAYVNGGLDDVASKTLHEILAAIDRVGDLAKTMEPREILIILNLCLTGLSALCSARQTLDDNNNSGTAAKEIE